MLSHTFDQVEWISLHTYLNNYADDTAAFLASPDLMDSFIEEVVAIADAVAARRKSSRRIMLSFDEWNVWYRTRRRTHNRTVPGWPEAPPILEEIYDMQDALAFGGACISLLNHADRVRSACLAQLVNVIAPIMTRTGGPTWRQTIFWPFAQMSRHGRGQVLRAQVTSGTYATAYFDPRGPNDPPIPLPAVPWLKQSTIRTADGVSMFLLNRHLTEPLDVTAELRSFGALTPAEVVTMHDADLKAINTEADPDRIRPRPLEGVAVTRTPGGGTQVRVSLPPASWTLLRLAGG